LFEEMVLCSGDGVAEETRALMRGQLVAWTSMLARGADMLARTLVDASLMQKI
jgi:hypothetical protein